MAHPQIHEGGQLRPGLCKSSSSKTLSMHEDAAQYLDNANFSDLVDAGEAREVLM
jgi:hypothetical protein